MSKNQIIAAFLLSACSVASFSAAAPSRPVIMRPGLWSESYTDLDNPTTPLTEQKCVAKGTYMPGFEDKPSFLPVGCVPSDFKAAKTRWSSKLTCRGNKGGEFTGIAEAYFPDPERFSANVQMTDTRSPELARLGPMKMTVTYRWLKKDCHAELGTRPR